MINFKQFMNLHAEKKCPPGYRFDTKLKVCVPIGQRGYVSYYGLGSGRSGGDAAPSPAPSNGNVTVTVMVTVVMVMVETVAEMVVANNEI